MRHNMLGLRVLLLTLTRLSWAGHSQATLGDDFYDREVGLLAQLKSRLTGSPNHNAFIDHLESELKSLGLTVQYDNFEFEYITPAPLLLNIGGQKMSPSALVPYSGKTGPDGNTGELVHIDIPATGSPAWNSAAGKIAVLNISNAPINGAKTFPVWPGSPVWGEIAGVPATNAGVRNLIDAAKAGVEGVIYAWTNITALNAWAQYGPFKSNYQGVPAIYVADSVSKAAISGAIAGTNATIVSTGELVEKQKTRSLWVVVEGSEIKNESVIISTHTDGSNVVEENGHLALLAKAQELVTSPPRRTTILVFLTGHLHTSGFTSTGRVMQEWFQLHPELWAGNTTDSLKAVFGSCVEHLGAIAWQEDLPNGLYYPTGQQQEELLYAATKELSDILLDVWDGAIPNLTRVIDPNQSLIEQSGEGLPFLWHNIPEVSLCTSPDWLLKEWPQDFDERQLMDNDAAKRQVESFLRLWGTVDGMSAQELGVVDYARIPQGL